MNENGELEALRNETDEINRQILALLSLRGELVQKIRDLKLRSAMDMFSPGREQYMLDRLVAKNPGPFPDNAIRRLFKEIFAASVALMEGASRQRSLVARRPDSVDRVVAVGTASIGDGMSMIAGPCAVEDEEQVEAVAQVLARRGVRFMRGGAFKPRTSPYSFQGLGEEGLVILERVARRHGLATVTEVVDTRSADIVAKYADIMQVGARNMANYELLKAVAGVGKPVLLKRGFAATLDEFLWAAEYLAASGTSDIILCERGIRTFNTSTRFTLDIAAVPLLRRETCLPVVVDVSHAAGRRDIITPLAMAAIGAGAQGVMVEVHPRPELARSDPEQQLDLAQFEKLLDAILPPS